MIQVYGLVYLITNLVNGKVYVGQTVFSLRDRFLAHIRTSRKKDDRPISRAIRRYGKENFKITPLCSCYSHEELNLMEDLYILSYDSLNRVVGYNLQRGGFKGHVSDETKEKIRKGKFGKTNGAYREDLPDSEVFLALYEQGLSLSKIAEVYRTNSTTIGNRLRKIQTIIRPAGSYGWSDDLKTEMSLRRKGKGGSKYRHDVNTSDLVSLYREGYSSTQIAARFSMTHGAVQKRIRGEGIQLRSTTEASVARKSLASISGG